MCHPVVSLGPRQCLINSVLKVFDMLTRIRFTLYRSRVRSGVQKHLYWVYFSPASHSLWYFSVPWGSPFFGSLARTWDPSYSVLLYFVTHFLSWPQSWEDREKDKKQQGSAHSPGTVTLPTKKGGSSQDPPLECRILWVLMACPCHRCYHIAWGLGHKRRGGREEKIKWNISLLSGTSEIPLVGPWAFWLKNNFTEVFCHQKGFIPEKGQMLQISPCRHDKPHVHTAGRAMMKYK